MRPRHYLALVQPTLQGCRSVCLCVEGMPPTQKCAGCGAQAQEEATRLAGELTHVKEQWATERAHNEKVISELKVLLDASQDRENKVHPYRSVVRVRCGVIQCTVWGMGVGVSVRVHSQAIREAEAMASEMQRFFEQAKASIRLSAPSAPPSLSSSLSLHVYVCVVPMSELGQHGS